MNSSSRSVERLRSTANGYVMLLVGLACVLVGIGMFFTSPRAIFYTVPLHIVAVFTVAGLYVLQPNEGAILLLFGAYAGTDRSPGLRWANPFYTKRKMSLRARNFNSEKIKVNDLRGNPIEIAAAIVWRVRDTAQAAFDVDDYERYVLVQSEGAIRHLASSYAYDDGDDLPPNAKTLRAGQDEVGLAMRAELQARLEPAGIDIADAKLTHLAYAPEIAQVMLRRQQAEAIIAARTRIVQGAVSMVEMAIRGLSERDIVHLDDERKAAMVSNLLVVLCAESDVQPVINSGTLYP